MDAPDPHLLQGDDVRLAGCDHLRDSRGSDLSVRAEPAVNVVGQDSNDPPLFLDVLQRSVPAWTRVDRYAGSSFGASQDALAPSLRRERIGSMDQNRSRFQKREAPTCTCPASSPEKVTTLRSRSAARVSVPRLSEKVLLWRRSCRRTRWPIVDTTLCNRRLAGSILRIDCSI